MRAVLLIPPSPGNRHIARFSFQSYESKGNYHLQPKEFMAITGCLSETDEVSFIDGTCDKLSKNEFLEKVSSVNGDIIFFSMSNTVWKSDFEYLMEVIERKPEVPIYVQGDIFLDGVSLKEYEIKNLRSHISLVGQHATLLTDTINRNICYGSIEEDFDKIISASEKAHADEFIRSLTDGYETVVGDNGVLLSGGQRQRIAIARALEF